MPPVAGECGQGVEQEKCETMKTEDVDGIATREDLFYVFGVILAGVTIAVTVALAIGLLLHAERMAVSAGTGCLFGLAMFLMSSKRAKRVARTPISKMMKRHATK